MEILLIRHGATAGNLEKRYIGRTDEPLCSAGVAQVEALKARNLHAAYVFASPLLRTRQTAAQLFPEIPCTLVEDLAETDFGVFEGRTAAELSALPAYQSWLDTMCTGPILGGERVDAFRARCCAAFCRITKTLPEDTCAAFVIHGGVIMSILEMYGEPKRPFYDWHVENGAALRCQFSAGRLRVLERF